MDESIDRKRVESALDRRGFLARAGALGAGLVAPGTLIAAPGDGVKTGKNASELMTPKTKAAIKKGLDFLAKSQITRGPDKGALGTSGYAGSVAVAGLAGLAWMSEGSTPGIGKYGKQVQGCMDFVARHVQPSGYISKNGQGVGNMYAHGFAMLFLSQAYGMTKSEVIGEKLKQAVKLTLSAQNHEGGWRYRPQPDSADLSVTVCQIMALRGARDAGINVPDAAREKCIDYVKKSQNLDEGSFRYTLRHGHATFALTAAGVVSLYSAGIYEGKPIEKALAYLSKERNSSGHGHYFYSHYYGVQAMWHAGDDRWNDWYPFIRDRLLKSQVGNGTWSSGYGAEYSTAMASIILQMPNDMLPIFAR